MTTRTKRPRAPSPSLEQQQQHPNPQGRMPAVAIAPELAQGVRLPVTPRPCSSLRHLQPRQSRVPPRGTRHGRRQAAVDPPPIPRVPAPRRRGDRRQHSGSERAAPDSSPGQPTPMDRLGCPAGLTPTLTLIGGSHPTRAQLRLCPARGAPSPGAHRPTLPGRAKQHLRVVYFTLRR